MAEVSSSSFKSSEAEGRSRPPDEKLELAKGHQSTESGIEVDTSFPVVHQAFDDHNGSMFLNVEGANNGVLFENQSPSSSEDSVVKASEDVLVDLNGIDLPLPNRMWNSPVKSIVRGEQVQHSDICQENEGILTSVSKITDYSLQKNAEQLRKLNTEQQFQSYQQRMKKAAIDCNKQVADFQTSQSSSDSIQFMKSVDKQPRIPIPDTEGQAQSQVSLHASPTMPVKHHKSSSTTSDSSKNGFFHGSGSNPVSSQESNSQQFNHKVEAGQFPEEPRHIIYNTEVVDLPLPKMEEQHVVGEGSYGKVVLFRYNNKEYAIKKTAYRQRELNIWSQLQHVNIIPLLAMMIGEKDRFCYQFMPLMSKDLGSIMTKHGAGASNLHTLLKDEPQNVNVFLENMKFVFAEISKGLAYLEGHRIQHIDLKAANVLFQISKECRCKSILHCTCGDKYTIKISDFDRAIQSKHIREPKHFSVCKTSMKGDKMVDVEGTKGYRAPERFKKCPKDDQYKKVVIDGENLHDMEGPWCDVWSMGVMLLKMILGKEILEHSVREAGMLINIEGNDIENNIEGNNIIWQKKKIYLCCIEALSVTIYLKKLSEICFEQPALIPLSKVAHMCLEIDYTKRPAAKRVLNILET